jgi:hypothetical protein
MLRQVNASDYQILTQIDNSLTKEKIANYRKGKQWFYVFEDNRYLKGYVVYILHVDHLEIVRLFVDPLYRRTSVATNILASLLKKLNDNRLCMTMTLSDVNLSGHLFLKNMGFIGSINLDDPSYYDFKFCVQAKTFQQI